MSALLADIFAGEDALAAASVSPAPETPLAGLDRRHAELVEKLAALGSMTRVEFGHAARALGLLPEGTIECINDWWFDRFDEPLIEERGEVVIAPDLRARLSALRDDGP